MNECRNRQILDSMRFNELQKSLIKIFFWNESRINKVMIREGKKKLITSVYE